MRVFTVVPGRVLPFLTVTWLNGKAGVMVGSTLVQLEDAVQEALASFEREGKDKLREADIPRDFSEDPRILRRQGSSKNVLVLFDSGEGAGDPSTTFSAMLPTETHKRGLVERGWKPLGEAAGLWDLRKTDSGKIGGEHQLLAVMEPGAAFVAEWGDRRATVEWVGGRYLYAPSPVRGVRRQKPRGLATVGEVVKLQAQA